jgi:hypothetical protein
MITFYYLVALFMCWRSTGNLVRMCIFLYNFFCHIFAVCSNMCNDYVEKIRFKITWLSASSEIDVKFVQISITYWYRIKK